MQSIIDNFIWHSLLNLILYIPGIKKLRELKIDVTGNRIIGNKDSTVALEWARDIYEKSKANQRDISDAEILEIGPGAFLGVATLLITKGAKKVTAVDVSNFCDLENTEQFSLVIETAKQEEWIKKDQHYSAEKILKNLEYLVSSSNIPVPDSSYDIVYSFHAGEHFRDPNEVIAEMHRVLKPGGLCIHSIDLHDHIGSHRVNNWLKFLYYEPWAWNIMTSNRGCWTNRLRSTQWREIFENHFTIIDFDARRQTIPSTFKASKLATPFKDYDLEILSVSSLNIIARKPLT